MQGKVLILGGYGNFGKYLATHLLKAKIPITLAGRNNTQLQKTTKHYQKLYNTKIQSLNIDLNDRVQFRKKLELHRPKLVINTCGPFQTADHNIVQDVIKTEAHYIDLADSRNFVSGMRQYDILAKQNNVTVITGASSVPGLSSAVLEKYLHEFQKIDSLKYGISPGQNTNRGGFATTKGVMGYIGKPIKLFGNLEKQIYAWQNLHVQKFPELGDRLFSNFQVADLDIFPQKYGINNIRFMAGTQNMFLHMSIWSISWLIRLGFPINLVKYSEFLHKMSHAVFDCLGTDQGGMFMNIKGFNKKGQQMQLKWYIIIKQGHGPNVPVIPAIVLAKKIMLQNYSLPGVHTCSGLVTLEQYLQQLKEFKPITYVQRLID